MFFYALSSISKIRVRYFNATFDNDTVDQLLTTTNKAGASVCKTNMLMQNCQLYCISQNIVQFHR